LAPPPLLLINIGYSITYFCSSSLPIPGTLRLRWLGLFQYHLLFASFSPGDSEHEEEGDE